MRPHHAGIVLSRMTSALSGEVRRRHGRPTDISACRLTRSHCFVAVLLSCISSLRPATVSAFSISHLPAIRGVPVQHGDVEQTQRRSRGKRRPRVGYMGEAAQIPFGSRTKALWVSKGRSDGRGFRGSGGTVSTEGLEDWKNWKALAPEEENDLCEQILLHRRTQNLQVELEHSEGRPVTVHEWAVAAGHPSSHQLLQALQEGRKAERTLVTCHQGLVRHLASRYRGVTQSLSFDDLVQEGTIGLLQAVGRFDASKGCRFSSYAVFRIKACMLRSIESKDRLIRVPTHAHEAAMRLLAMQHTLEAESSPGAPPPTDAQLALALSMPEATVSFYRNSVLKRDVADLDNPTYSQADTSMEGRVRIGGEKWPWGETPRLVETRMMREDILRVMRECLSPAEERVLRLRFGMEQGVGDESAMGGQAMRTFKEIGRTMELSAEGIRRMAGRAMKKLQASDEAHGLLLAYASALM